MTTDIKGGCTMCADNRKVLTISAKHALKWSFFRNRSFKLQKEGTSTHIKRSDYISILITTYFFILFLQILVWNWDHFKLIHILKVNSQVFNLIKPFEFNLNLISQNFEIISETFQLQILKPFLDIIITVKGAICFE